MANMLQFKALICWEVIKNERQLKRALKKVEQYAKIALRTGRLLGIDLKELEEPPKFKKHKNRKALGLSGTCAGE